jgi:hypothetical protein
VVLADARRQAVPLDGRVQASLAAEHRCKYSGHSGGLVCIGHWDYYDDAMVWTRHYVTGQVGFKLVPYDHPAPERILETRLERA